MFRKVVHNLNVSKKWKENVILTISRLSTSCLIAYLRDVSTQLILSLNFCLGALDQTFRYEKLLSRNWMKIPDHWDTFWKQLVLSN